MVPENKKITKTKHCSLSQTNVLLTDAYSAHSHPPDVTEMQFVPNTLGSKLTQIQAPFSPQLKATKIKIAYICKAVAIN